MSKRYGVIILFKKRYVIIVGHSLEREIVAYNRTFGLSKSLKKLGNDIELCFPNKGTKDVGNYNFADAVYYYNARHSWLLEKMKTEYKKYRGVQNMDNSASSSGPKIPQGMHSFITNNFLYYNHFFSPASGCYYKINYSQKIMNDIFSNRKDNNNIIITSSSPSIMNYFGYRIKKKWPNVFWIADYRDLNQKNPYKTDEYNFQSIRMDKMAFKYADVITTVSNSAMEQNIENADNMGIDIRGRTYVLYNGFLDDEAVPNGNEILYEKYKGILSSEKVVIVFTGMIYPLRRVDIFLEALTEIDNILFVYAGVSFNLIDQLVKKLRLESRVVNLRQISKDEALFLQRNSDILLQLKADVKEDGILTGKFFEYLRTNKRILSLGDKDEEYNEICKNLKNVDVLPYNKVKIVEYLKKLKKSELKEEYDPNVERFSWYNLAKSFDEFVSEKLRERKSNK